MATVADLQAQVSSRCARLGLPTWPDPHPGMTSPRDEEYSRVTDPGRYRIVHERARAWAAVLAEALGARPEAVRPAPAARDAQAFDRGLRLVPRHVDALPLLLLERDVPWPDVQETLAVLTLAVARPDVVVDTQPDCGCDACDSGSEDLLDAVDAVIRSVVAGPFVALRGSGWRAEWHPEGGSAGGTALPADFREVMHWCRRLAAGEDVALPPDTEVLLGRSWMP